MDTKVWFITGASRGLGLEFARTALDKGCRVAATARNPEAISEALGMSDNLLLVQLDVTDEASMRSAVKQVANRFGRIDVLVNNAGYGIFGALEETTDAETKALFDTNLFGPMNVIRAVLPTMRAQHGGRIVNIASMAGYATDPGGSLYDASKFAVVGLTEVLAQELAEFDIQCMVVCPGMVRTNFFDGSSMKVPGRLMPAYEHNPSRGAIEYCLSHNYQQYGDPQKIAQLVYDIAASDSMPLWLPVGKDAMKKLARKCESMLETVKPYYDASCATSFPRQ